MNTDWPLSWGLRGRPPARTCASCHASQPLNVAAAFPGGAVKFSLGTASAEMRVLGRYMYVTRMYGWDFSSRARDLTTSI